MIDPVSELNKAIFDNLSNLTEKDETQQALDALANLGDTDPVDAINDFTRTRMRIDGFTRKILPPIQINNDELDRSMPTDKPIKWLLGDK